MTNDEQRAWYISGAGRSGVAVAPLPFFDARAMPHPLAALVQRSRLTGAWASVRHKHYVAAMDPGWAARSPFLPTRQRLHADPAWTVHDLRSRTTCWPAVPTPCSQCRCHSHDGTRPGHRTALGLAGRRLRHLGGWRRGVVLCTSGPPP